MKVIIAGGDGFCGWPTALYLSNQGHEVIIVDSLVRRKWDQELHSNSLTPIAGLKERIACWQALTGKIIKAFIGDLNHYDFLREILIQTKPEAFVHFAEQRSAPYSMIDRDHAVFTQVNNVVGTLNVLYGIREVVPNCHLINLGSMGEYGTPNIDIEEGYLTITHKGREDRLPFTVLNRFLAQAATGQDLTVYGKGGQTRGFLNIVDTIRCIEIAMINPDEQGEFRVFNQFTEEFSILDLAHKVQEVAKANGFDTHISHLENPRIENEDHYYQAAHSKLQDLGLEPHLLTNDVLNNIFCSVLEHKNRLSKDNILPKIQWA
ncbi:NAD-dependent epimerase/dehydratase family protein [Desulfosporosinus sp. SYSU MS00001]|uniref:NAD-dependent epimerase/dehydratase family protein n=1 Tax=Desulfosporosinus sp. SYSU MS00001 TaxID=3416284 RepID=UPI003CEE6D9A